MNSKGWSVADEKKPVDGTEENAEGEAAKTPETELTPEAVPDAVVTEDLVRDVFGMDSRVIPDPVSGSPVVLPMGRHHVRR